MKRLFFAGVFLALLASRLCHIGILWTEEDLPMAAAIQMLSGKALYRDIWFDKPPLVPSVYLLWGATPGVPLRIAGALFCFAACWLIYRLARRLWSEREGRLAAALLAFFLICGIPAAVIPLAADLLMILPHIAAVYFAVSGNPVWSGAAAGIAFLANSKGVFVLAACALWQWRAAPLLLTGFALPNAIALAWLGLTGSLHAYWEQVWWLGLVYAKNTFVSSPVAEGVRRTLNWAGFHAALVAGALWFWARDHKPERWRIAIWGLLSLATIAGGWRFFPRYYFQLLPVAAVAGARGLSMMGARWRVLALALLLVPLARFGPRYTALAAGLFSGHPSRWSDVSMDRDSAETAARLSSQARPGETLFVWGYRPDIFVYSRMPAGTRFLESQPLTGVFADRQLFQTDAVEHGWAERNRKEVARTRPSFIVDGLSYFNPRLSMEAYPELRPWLALYEPAGGTQATRIYRLARK